MTLRSSPELPHGIHLLHDPRFNKGTAFTQAERDALGLRGLLPPYVTTMAEQVDRVLMAFRAKPDSINRYIYLAGLLDRNETLFYRLVVDHIDEMMPIIYTPTVGLACQTFGQIFRRARGMFVTANDRNNVRRVLANWPARDVRAIVVTDGERILGLGDLGANGMGIPVGKLSLYTACAGVHPAATLPVTIDVGTENEALLADPHYLGLRRKRVRGDEYDALVDEFVIAANERWPGVLIQFEDFANRNAFRLLETYRDRVCTFNDDIQGTASVALAGLLSAMRALGAELGDQRILFLGAGEAGIGIANLVVATLVSSGIPEADARRVCWFVDSGGLVVKSRDGLTGHKLPYAHESAGAPDLLSAVRTVTPTALIGVSGRASMFTAEVLQEMARINTRPIVFALSNPTAHSECTAEEAYAHTGGRALFASGSPFAAVEVGGKQFAPGQANNAYIFPGLALGVISSGARRVTDEMFSLAAKTVAGNVSSERLAAGKLFPPLSSIREVSFQIAVKVAEATGPSAEARVRENLYEPVYASYL